MSEKKEPLGMNKAAWKVVRAMKLARRQREVLGTDFNYVVSRPEKGKIFFGSGIERDTSPINSANYVTKHGRMYTREIIKTISPGMYGIHPWTTAMGKLLTQPTSNLGTYIGGRKFDRSKPIITSNMLTPAPCTYDLPTSFPLYYEQNKAPFNIRSKRITMKISNYPGVGTYNASVQDTNHRVMKFRYSFNGKKVLIPAVDMKCGPHNFDICEICKTKPYGDYWKMNVAEVQSPKTSKTNKNDVLQSEGIFLCRPCYEIERKTKAVFNKQQMLAFKKVRDCSQVHQHDGCEAKLLLVPPKDLDKLKEREAYLALYFS